MIDFDKLIAAITEDAMLERILTNLEAIGLKVRTWRKAGVYRTILRIIAGIFAAFWDQVIRFIRSSFLELAEGDWLTWVAFYVYGVDRPGATFASGVLTVTNGGGGDYTFTAGAFRTFNPTTKKAYTNVAPFSLPPLGSATIDVIAVEVGAASSSAADTITGVETQYVDAGVMVTNVAPVVGSDAMPDDDLKQVCKDSLGARSVYGPRTAYSYAIRTAKRSDGTTVDINRLSVSPSSSVGTVTIYVASPSGVPIASDLTAVADNIEDKARPDTAKVVLAAADAKSIARTLTVWAKKDAGVTPSDLKALVETQLVDLNRKYPIGGIRKAASKGYFWADNLDGAVQKAHEAIYSVDGLGADVSLEEHEVPVLSITVADVRLVDVEVH